MGLLSRLTSAFRSEGSFTVSAEPLAAGALRSVVGESYYKPALERTAAIAVPGRPPLPVGASGLQTRLWSAYHAGLRASRLLRIKSVEVDAKA
jgi:hypothetical protein